MKLFGTTTSPFVRRVRVVAAETGQHVDLVNTATDEGQEKLRRATPIWKVPVAEIGERYLFDSRAIIEWLTTFHGWGTMRAPIDRWRELNLVNAIDGALESAIQLFYLRREGMDPMQIPFGQRQVDRISSIFGWISTELGHNGFGSGLGLSELSLVCALDWMDFRDTYPTARHDADFGALRADLRERASLAATRPVVS
jgi:glutathione S-transferase